MEAEIRRYSDEEFDDISRTYKELEGMQSINMSPENLISIYRVDLYCRARKIPPELMPKDLKNYLSRIGKSLELG